MIKPTLASTTHSPRNAGRPGNPGLLARGLLIAVIAGGLAFAAALPASADPTTTTFTLTGGSIVISVAGTAALGDSVSGDTSISGQLGAVTVTDERGGTVAWNLGAGSSTFISTPTNAGSTSSSVAYSTGTVTVTGTVTAPAVTAQVLTLTDASIIQSSGVSGNNTATFNPTLAVTLPAAAIAGDYEGTVTTSLL